MPDTSNTQALPLLPIKSAVLFPTLGMPLSVGRKSSVSAAQAASATEDKTIIVATQKDSEVENPGFDDLYPIATRAVIKRLDRGRGNMQLIVQGVERVELLGLDAHGDYPKATVRVLAAPDDSSAEIEALRRTVMDHVNKIVESVNPQAQGELVQLLGSLSDPIHQVYFLASMLSLDIEKEIAILGANTRLEALRLIYDYVRHEAQVIELRQKIQSQAEGEVNKAQREYMLRQQLRAIQEELGEEDPQKAEAGELRRKITEANLPEAIQKEADRELAKLERLPTAAPDYQVTRSYLDLISELPWNKTTEDLLDLSHARQVLDEDHYGLKEVKERIIEHLAVLKLNPGAKAPILCFVGPPGVGKTSLGKSIARSLGRNFERMSLGGLHDEAELRGHRRTYIGAMPGRIIQAVRRAGVRNPVLMLDEVDKLGRDFRGDPSAALLEILDPAQNFEFRDNYLDLPFDLSQVFFVTTANSLDSIPQPLLDRMEILRVAGYSDEEKLHIGRRYLIPRQLKETGIATEQLTIPNETLARVIRGYTREAGVRQLERTLGTLARKVATRFAEGNTDAMTVTPDDLNTLLGPEKFFSEDARKRMGPGVAAGLAWTPVGGEVLYVEAVLLPEGKDLILTGQLGDVMKESVSAAKSYLASQANELGLSAATIRSGVHVHVPAGATPKDGPSAGVTMATALASLYSGRPIRSDTAMTGEITLSGLVMPVGGIKEKFLAAHRAGIRRIIMPKQNVRDLAEIPEHVRQQMEFIPVENIPELLQAAIPDLTHRAIAA